MHAMPQVVSATFFHDVRASRAESVTLDWAELCELIRTEPAKSTKKECRMIKLARFGDIRTDKGAIRHDANVIEVTGIEGDYDLGQMTMDQALDLLERHQLKALIYESWSSAPDAPRWRVITPLSKSVKPLERLRYAEALNGMLGGTLASESSRLSLSYFFGSPFSRPPRVLHTFDNPEEGFCLDEIDDIDVLRVPFPVLTKETGDAVTHEDFLQSLLKGDDLHENALRLVGRLVAKGVDDALIKGIFDALWPQVAQHRGWERIADMQGGELQRMIDGARAKGFEIEIGPDLEDPSTQEELTLDLGEIPLGFDPSRIKPRPWVAKDRLLQGAVTISAAPPGCGKTAFEIASAVSVCLGHSYLGEELYQSGRAWIYANEEDTDELLRRYGAFALLHKIKPDSLRGQLRLSSGYGRSLVVARKLEGSGELFPTPEVDMLIKALKDWQCLTFAVDPLISTHRGNENSNADLEQVMDSWRRVAAETNCAIQIPTHIPKGAGEDSEAHAGNLNAIRGASAIGGAARQVITLARMSKRSAEDFGLDPVEARDYVRFDRAKGNYSPAPENAQWLEMVGVCLDNDPARPDWVGAFKSHPGFQKLEGLREAHKDEAASAYRVAVKMIGLKPGQKVALSDVIDELVGHTRKSKAWLQDNIAKVFPQHGSVQASGSEFSWSKDAGKTGKKFLHCEL